MSPILRLGDLFAGALHSLDWYVQNDLVVRRHHPTLPYAVLNYTQRCAYERAWDLVTRKCRGLIYNATTNEVIARPFEKFFNYGEFEEYDDNSVGEVYDKLDGSLGILYPVPGGHSIATRGSFESDQALWATELWHKKYASRFVPVIGWTYLFEIIYPENRIVLDYGMTQDIFLLETLSTYTGQRVKDSSWPGPRPQEIGHDITLKEALELGDRENREGIIFVEQGTGRRIKVKQQDYIEKHKAKFGLNARVVWEVLSNGHSWNVFIDSVPAEFYDWVEEVKEALLDAFEAHKDMAFNKYNEIIEALPPDYTRKDFALKATAVRFQNKLGPSVLFNIHDGKSIDDYVWQLLFPSADWKPKFEIEVDEK